MGATHERLFAMNFRYSKSLKLLNRVGHPTPAAMQRLGLHTNGMAYMTEGPATPAVQLNMKKRKASLTLTKVAAQHVHRVRKTCQALGEELGTLIPGEPCPWSC